MANPVSGFSDYSFKREENQDCSDKKRDLVGRISICFQRRVFEVVISPKFCYAHVNDWAKNEVTIYNSDFKPVVTLREGGEYEVILDMALGLLVKKVNKNST